MQKNTQLIFIKTSLKTHKKCHTRLGAALNIRHIWAVFIC